jgi:septum formation protein
MSELLGPAAASRVLVLASQSPARRALLAKAGVRFETEPAHIDESAVLATVKAEQGGADDAALMLAALKAERVARRRGPAIVLGCDQLLDCEGSWLEKPGDRAQAASQLQALAGKRHELVSAVVAFVDGERAWHHVDRARLTMRTLDRDFIEAYLTAAGDQVLGSVGAYQLEGLGAQLFARVEGDYFTVLGLPLLPVLDFLRQHGLVRR